MSSPSTSQTYSSVMAIFPKSLNLLRNLWPALRKESGFVPSLSRRPVLAQWSLICLGVTHGRVDMSRYGRAGAAAPGVENRSRPWANLRSLWAVVSNLMLGASTPKLERCGSAPTPIPWNVRRPASP